ncbi:hypothetical protein Acr_13g0002030 [Actinidia rufa]|uniref:Uncharacterized protein n=1 Tax=Actinidia rufa TaxID=165716 RepID=A0A7J0FJD7_9ERIC|nr:hypothetical protein Acr_13g0002030 [Actinidia rufa]
MKVHPAPKRKGTSRCDTTSLRPSRRRPRSPAARRSSGDSLTSSPKSSSFRSAPTQTSRSGNDVVDLSVDELELDLWRFRLPEATIPEMASAVYSEGELVVTVPKDANFDVSDGEDGGVWGEGNGGIGAGRFVLVL